MALRLLFRWLTLLLLAALPHAVMADPPGRVGRLADVQGGVSFYDAETADWVAAARNLPLTTGDRVSTDASGRAELRVGSATFRLGAGTDVEVLQLDDERVRVQVHSGQLALRLRSNESAHEFELVTSEARFQPERAGQFRLDRIDASSRITVWSGQLVFEAHDVALTLVAGQRADLWRNAGRTDYTLVAPQRDPFSDEVATLELADMRSVSARYVSPEMTGAEELDRHGRWENDVEYGALWVPRAVVPGWAPYRFGHWAWVRPWGWTWIDDAPWGFAPFHYGRWVFLRSAWCWSPGRWVPRPVYAPALVAWVGTPMSVSIGAGPNVGWFPLGPREVFVPGYRTSPHYVRNVNVTQVTNITNITTIINQPNTVVQQTRYMNRGVPGAMTVVPASVVAGRQPVAPSRVHLTDPRPGAGDGRGLPQAALASATAVPPVQPAAPLRGRGAPPTAPAAPAAGGHAAQGTAGPGFPPPTAAGRVPSPPPPGKVAISPSTLPPGAPPAARSPQPAVGVGGSSTGRGDEPHAVAPPASVVPTVAMPARPTPPPGASRNVPATTPPAMAPQPARAPAPTLAVPAAPVAQAPAPQKPPPAPSPQPTAPPPPPKAPPPARPPNAMPPVAAPTQPPRAPPPVAVPAQPPKAMPPAAAPPAPATHPPGAQGAVSPKPTPTPPTRAQATKDEPRGAGKAEK